MLTHRLQVLVEPDQHERLRREADRRGTTIGALVREAIDRALPDDAERRRAAYERLLGMGPIPVPEDPDELEAELDGMFGGAA